MCIADRKYCKRRARKFLKDALRNAENYHFALRELNLDLAAAWMVMYASAK